MTNANCTQRFPCACEILMFQDQASSFSAQVLFQPSTISSQGFFRPDCFSSLEFNPAKVLFHVRRETILEWTFSRQGLFPATSFFQAEAFSRHVPFPASRGSPSKVGLPSKVLTLEGTFVKVQSWTTCEGAPGEGPGRRLKRRETSRLAGERKTILKIGEVDRKPGKMVLSAFLSANLFISSYRNIRSGHHWARKAGTMTSMGIKRNKQKRGEKDPRGQPCKI